MEDREIFAMNVIPFVDIMLVLLTIVLISATFIALGKIPVNLPVAHGEPSKETIRLYITKEGGLYFNEVLLSKRELEEQLDSLPRDLQVFVGADRMVTVDRLVEFLDLLKKKGFQKISLGVRER